MRIVFRSDNRYRGYAFAAQDAATMTGPTHAEGEAPSVARRPFSVRERVDVDGMLCLTVLGELDFAVAEVLGERQLEVAPEVSPSVEQAAQIVGIAQVLWPEQRPDARSDAADAGTQYVLAPTRQLPAATEPWTRGLSRLKTEVQKRSTRGYGD